MEYREGSNRWLRKLLLRDPPKPEPARTPDRILGRFNATGFHPAVEASTTADDSADEIQE